jgi:Ca2+-binding RTX toxin-like protein
LGDSIRILNFYTSENYRHIEFEFSNGTIINISDLALGEIKSGNGTINGTDFADILTGGSGNDAIYGGGWF